MTVRIIADPNDLIEPALYDRYVSEVTIIVEVPKRLPKNSIIYGIACYVSTADWARRDENYNGFTDDEANESAPFNINQLIIQTEDEAAFYLFNKIIHATDKILKHFSKPARNGEEVRVIYNIDKLGELGCTNFIIKHKSYKTRIRCQRIILKAYQMLEDQNKHQNKQGVKLFPPRKPPHKFADPDPIGVPDWLGHRKTAVYTHPKTATRTSMKVTLA